MTSASTMTIAMIGFGEAARAFVSGWTALSDLNIAAYDIKTDSADKAVSAAKWADYAAAGVTGCATLAEALTGAELVVSLVTADQAASAAASAARLIAPGTLYFECNSCAPGTKRANAEKLSHAGARLVDVAVMAPVHPALHKTPILYCGPHAADAASIFARLDMNAKPVEGDIGTASAIKMIRSVMIKGIEALVAECTLSARAAGVEDAVLDSLDKSFPGFNWRDKSAYMLERVMTHGIRRAAEMREVALTVDELGLKGDMARATVEWQQRIGDLHLNAAEIGEDYAARADALLGALSPHAKTPS